MDTTLTNSNNNKDTNVYNTRIDIENKDNKEESVKNENPNIEENNKEIKTNTKNNNYTCINNDDQFYQLSSISQQPSQKQPPPPPPPALPSQSSSTQLRGLSNQLLNFRANNNEQQLSNIVGDPNIGIISNNNNNNRINENITNNTNRNPNLSMTGITSSLNQQQQHPLQHLSLPNQARQQMRPYAPLTHLSQPQSQIQTDTNQRPPSLQNNDGHCNNSIHIQPGSTRTFSHFVPENIRSNTTFQHLHHPQLNSNTSMFQKQQALGSCSFPSGTPNPSRPRELKVEDALLYLDQVKQQFGNQPDIYNHFLEVMKSFKSQTIDTPGVIQRVSSLFRGYPKLILGFNTFLPPGYKIRPDSTLVYPPNADSNQPSTSNRPLGSENSLNQSIKKSLIPSSPSRDTNNNEVIVENQSHTTQIGNTSNVSNNPFRTHSQVKGHSPPQSSSIQLPHLMNPMIKQESSASHLQRSSSTSKHQFAAINQSAQSQAQSSGPLRDTGTPVEFDHAINYVTTIKQRFRDQPGTYKAFLEILHTYQKEQRTIKEVLDQVSDLFRDHPDLLREFTYFLPDSVQEQAKDRLNEAAEKAQARHDQRLIDHELAGTKIDDYAGIDRFNNQGDSHPYGMQSASSMMVPRSYNKQSGIYSGSSGRVPRIPKPRKIGIANSTISRYERKDKDIERGRKLYQQKKSKRRTGIGIGSPSGNSFQERTERRELLAMNEIAITKEEYVIFEKIRKAMPSRDSWREFIKCLEVYSQDLLSRSEMISLVSDLLGRHYDLIEEFSRIITEQGSRTDQDQIWPYLPLAETDLSQSRRCTPSYRALPINYPNPPCSQRTSLENEVCNDQWVSVPTGSEDFSFKSMRKNQYEEALFKCEDERYEMDMILDANASTIALLEPLNQEIEILKNEKEGICEELLYNYQLKRGLIKVIHCNAITRIYGESGNKLLELLRKYPAGTIPVILAQLKKKQDEWKKAKIDLNRQWKEVNEKNYHKSLDHSSFYFKQQDKKRISLKALINEAKQKLEKPDASDVHETVSEELQSEQIEVNDKPSTHFRYKLCSLSIHRDIFNLIAYACEKNLSSNEKERIGKLWTDLWLPFFGLHEEWMLHKSSKGLHSSIDNYHLYPPSIPRGTINDLVNKTSKLSRTKIFYGTQISYAFLRLYEVLFHRLESAKELCMKARRRRDQSTLNPAARALGLHNGKEERINDSPDTDIKTVGSSNNAMPSQNPNVSLDNTCHVMENDTDVSHWNIKKEVILGDYQTYVSKLYAFIDGSIDSTRYEDYCRSLMGSRSYFLFTIDKLVNHILKHLQSFGSDKTLTELIELFHSTCAIYDNNKTESDDMQIKTEYLTKARAILDGEEIYEFEFDSGLLKENLIDVCDEQETLTKDDVENKDKEKQVVSTETNKIWAPSPRVNSSPSTPWIVEPTLSITYLGSLDDEESVEDEDVDESISTSPMQSPIGTPLSSSHTIGIDDENVSIEYDDEDKVSVEDNDNGDRDEEAEDSMSAYEDELKGSSRKHTTDYDYSCNDNNKKPKLSDESIIRTSSQDNYDIGEIDDDEGDNYENENDQNNDNENYQENDNENRNDQDDEE